MYCEYIISRNNTIAITISDSVKIKFLVPTSTEATMKSLVFCVKEAICRFGQASTRHDCTGSRKYRQLIKMNNFCYYRLPIFFRLSLISRIVRSTWCLVSFLQPWIIRSFATTGFLYSFVDHWSVVSWYQIFWIVQHMVFGVLFACSHTFWRYECRSTSSFGVKQPWMICNSTGTGR